MKKIIFLFFGITTLIFVSCTTESIEDGVRSELSSQYERDDKVDPNDPDELDVKCVSVSLIAGQHHESGNVSVYNDGENLTIIISTNKEWTLDLTHLSIGNCDEDWVPLTGSGNPQIGQFEFTEPYSVSDHEIIYVVSLKGLNDNYCFAVHAEVQGPTGGETAWAEGTEFSGNSWAMFVESQLSECSDGEGDDDDDDDDDVGDPV